MDDDDIHQTISRLVGEEHELRQHGEHSESDRERLSALERRLDACWDLLRQREALRDAGADPDRAQARPEPEVESYLQ